LEHKISNCGLIKETQVQDYIDKKLVNLEKTMQEQLASQCEIEIQKLKTEVMLKENKKKASDIKKIESDLNEWTRAIEIQVNVILMITIDA